MTPISTRLPDELVEIIDQLVADGSFENRTHVVRTALTRLAEDEERRRIDESIIAGYTRIPAEPPTEFERDMADRSINAEPW